MLRKDGEFVFYTIQAYYREHDKWYDIGDKYYLKQYEYSGYGANGECWQEIGENGSYDFEYIKQFCNALNDGLRNGIIKSETGYLTGFRIIKNEVSQKREPLEPNRY